MNFKDLMSKLSEIDGSVSVPHDSTASPLTHTDNSIEECGPSGMMDHGQPDNVSMNVSMNGSGAGGIRDLIDILRNIDGGPEESEDDLAVDIKSMDHPHDDEEGGEEELIFSNDMEEESYENEPHAQYSPVGTITATGDDLASKGDERPKVNGGGNPYAVTQEGIKRNLENLYQEVKSR